jgi:hypothetical protein
VMAEPEPHRILYSVFVQVKNRFAIPDPSYDEGFDLDYDAIKVLYERPDFPRAKLEERNC